MDDPTNELLMVLTGQVVLAVRKYDKKEIDVKEYARELRDAVTATANIIRARIQD